MGLNVLIELHKFGMHGKNMGLNVAALIWHAWKIYGFKCVN
jgi:hypothetical protein